MKQKCLLLGGGGFIGSHLAKKLLDDGYAVRIFDIRNFSHKNISSLYGDIEIFEGDFNNISDIKIPLQGIDHVFHLVSSTVPANSMINPLFDIETNLISSVRLLQECLKQKKIKSQIFISSGGTVYGIPKIIPIPETHPALPLNSYGIIKYTIENYYSLYRRLWGLNCRIFRLSNPFGENQNPTGIQGAVTVFLNKAISGQQIEVWGDGKIVRDYIYIDDVTDVLTRSLEIDTNEFVFNIGSGMGYNLNEIIKIIKQITGIDVMVNYTYPRKFDVPVNILDITKAKSVFSWTPKVSIHEGIEKVYKHLKINSEG